MQRMIHYALGRRATRFIAVPALALAAGVALVSIGVTAGTIPTAFTAAAPSRGCGAGHPVACDSHATAIATVKSLHLAPAPTITKRPAIRWVRQPASPMTADAKARAAQMQSAIRAMLGTSTKPTAPTK
jgi:hypothetical protein